MYQGEELGLIDAVIPPDRIVDVDGRDGCRAPVPWTAAADHGWPHDPWLPFVVDADAGNVATLREQPLSILHLYRDLLRLRHHHAALQVGAFEMIDRDDDVLAYSRSTDGTTIIVALNLGVTPAELQSAAGQRVLMSTLPLDLTIPFDGTVAPQSALICTST